MSDDTSNLIIGILIALVILAFGAWKLYGWVNISDYQRCQQSLIISEDTCSTMDGAPRVLR